MKIFPLRANNIKTVEIIYHLAGIVHSQDSFLLLERQHLETDWYRRSNHQCSTALVCRKDKRSNDDSDMLIKWGTQHDSIVLYLCKHLNRIPIRHPMITGMCKRERKRWWGWYSKHASILRGSMIQLLLLLPSRNIRGSSALGGVVLIVPVRGRSDMDSSLQLEQVTARNPGENVDQCVAATTATTTTAAVTPVNPFQSVCLLQ